MHVDTYNYAIQEHLINRLGRDFYNKLGKRINSMQKNFVKKDRISVFGHSHCPEFSINENYINTGYTTFDRSYVLKIEEDEVSLKEFRY